MALYECDRCHERFTEEEIEVEYGISSAPMEDCTEDEEVCPYCGCASFYEVEE